MYTKLFATITDSTIWCEDSDTRVVWVTLLAMADKYGEVRASIPGLAKRSNVSIEAVEIALEKFRSPDKYSMNQENEGRRIKDMDGGWTLLNYTKYQAIRNAEERSEYMRIYQRKRRAKVDNVNNVSVVNPSDTDTDANTRPLAAALEGYHDSQAPPSVEIPTELHPLNYAAKILEELSFPHTSDNMKVVSAAIEAEVRSGKSAASAFEFILAGTKDARDEGIEINRFFFSDARYRRENRRSKMNGKESLAERNKRALEEYERRSK